MKVTQEEVVDRQTVLHIELEDEDLDTYLDQGYRRIAHRTMVPGFRKGKAPRRIVERFVGRESLLSEVIDSMLPDVATRAISGQELDAAGLPRLELLEMDPVTVKATVPLTPAVDLGSYRDIRISQEPIEVTDEDVEKRLDEVREGMASWEPVERPVEMGDMVTLAAVGTVEGRTVLDEKDAVFLLDEESSRPFPGFAERLVGLVVDDPGEFDMAIPEDHPDGTIAGKEAQFSATVSEIKQKVLPELDDELAKGYRDGFESLETLNKGLREDLEAEAENAASRGHKESIITALVESATIELPPVMVDHEVDHMRENQESILGRLGVRVDDYLRSIGKSEDEMGAEMRGQAVERLQNSFVLSKVAETEGLEVSEQEVADRVQETLSEPTQQGQGNHDPDELEGAARRMLLVEKTMDRLVAIAKGEAPPPPEIAVEPPAQETDNIQVDSPQGEGDTDDEQA